MVRHGHPHTLNQGRQAVGIVSDKPTDGPQTLQVDGGDAHIIINKAGGGVGGVEVGVGVGPVRVSEVGSKPLRTLRQYYRLLLSSPDNSW